MKKLLLGTTAILGVAGFASAALADAPRVTVGGFIDFQAAYSDQDVNAAGDKDYGFRNDTEVHFSVDGKTDAGLGYGAVIELEADISDDTTGSGSNADRTYVYLDGNWGRFELGGNSDVNSALKVDASSIARATGGIDGDWFRFVNVPGAVAGAFIVRPDLATQHGGETTPGLTENAAKINYYSPNWAGFQLGVSFTPSVDPLAKGQNTAITTPILFGAEDVFAIGATYNRQFDKVALGLSATSEFGDGVGALSNDVESYALGANVGFAGFNLAGSWGNVEGLGLDGDYWTAGLAYDFKGFGTSVTYLDSSNDVAGGGSNDFQNLTFGVDYAVAPGLTPYAELSFAEYDGVAAVGDNDATVFIVGTQLAF